MVTGATPPAPSASDKSFGTASSSKPKRLTWLTAAETPMFCVMRIDTAFIDFSSASRSRDGPKYLPLKFSGRHALERRLANRRRAVHVEHDGRRRIAVLERRRVHERLERRARLAAGLRGAVEIVQEEVEAAVQRDDGSVERIERDERTLRFRNCARRQAPSAVAEAHDVARLQNLGDRRRLRPRSCRR